MARIKNALRHHTHDWHPLIVLSYVVGLGIVCLAMTLGWPWNLIFVALYVPVHVYLFIQLKKIVKRTSAPLLHEPQSASDPQPVPEPVTQALPFNLQDARTEPFPVIRDDRTTMLPRQPALDQTRQIRLRPQPQQQPPNQPQMQPPTFNGPWPPQPVGWQNPGQHAPPGWPPPQQQQPAQEPAPQPQNPEPDQSVSKMPEGFNLEDDHVREKIPWYRGFFLRTSATMTSILVIVLLCVWYFRDVSDVAVLRIGIVSVLLLQVYIWSVSRKDDKHRPDAWQLAVPRPKPGKQDCSDWMLRRSLWQIMPGTKNIISYRRDSRWHILIHTRVPSAILFALLLLWGIPYFAGQEPIRLPVSGAVVFWFIMILVIAWFYGWMKWYLFGFVVTDEYIYKMRTAPKWFPWMSDIYEPLPMSSVTVVSIPTPGWFREFFGLYRVAIQNDINSQVSTTKSARPFSPWHFVKDPREMVQDMARQALRDKDEVLAVNKKMLELQERRFAIEQQILVATESGNKHLTGLKFELRKLPAPQNRTDDRRPPRSRSSSAPGQGASLRKAARSVPGKKPAQSTKNGR